MYGWSMSARPYHHGTLRAVLLDLAEGILRVEGVDALSLRELARRAGVTHSAPRKHFVDRQALLHSLAERGFVRLTQMAYDVMDTAGDFESMFRQYGACYVGFASSDAALLNLMFAVKLDDQCPAVVCAAERFYATFDDVVERGRQAGWFQNADVPRLRLLFVAAMQGIATLLASGRITRTEADTLVTDATTLVLRSPSAGDARERT
jgi:AcrR family transcriptional regulator